MKIKTETENIFETISLMKLAKLFIVEMKCYLFLINFNCLFLKTKKHEKHCLKYIESQLDRLL